MASALTRAARPPSDVAIGHWGPRLSQEARWVTLATEIGNCVDDAVECRAALLVDLDSGLVLATSSEGGESEADEALAAAACELLGRAQPAALVATGRAFDHAVVASPGALSVFHRLEAEPERALCLAFAPSAVPDLALAHARARQKAVGAAGLW